MFRYPIRLTLHALKEFPLFLMVKTYGALFPKTSMGSWSFVNFLPSQQSIENELNEALAFINETCPVNYRRIVKEVAVIIQRPCFGGGYLRSGKIVSIDLTAFKSWEVCYSKSEIIAMVLVHEATHGHLFSKRVQIGSKVRMDRAESVCWRQTHRFSRKLGKPLFEMPIAASLDEETLSPSDQISSILRRNGF